MDEVYVTFSGDGGYAFVQRSSDIASPDDALVCLDGQLRSGRVDLPRAAWWNPAFARVLECEVWDEMAGRRSEHQHSGTRALWRIDVRSALALASGAPSSDELLTLLRALRTSGKIDAPTFAHAQVLHDSFERAERERALRQAERAPDAPRAPLGDLAGIVLSQLLIDIVTSIDPERSADRLAAARRSVESRIAREVQVQVRRLRVEMDCFIASDQ